MKFDILLPQLINFASIVVILGYYFWEKNKFKKEGNSVLNRLVEREYKKWYKRNSESIKYNKITVYELNKLLYELKIKLEEKGIDKKHIEDYVYYLENKKNNSSWVINTIISVVGFFNIKEIVKSYSTQVISGKEENTNLIDRIINFFGENSKFFTQAFSLIFLIFLILLLVYTIYATLKMESVNLNNLRISLLKELQNIWEYKVVKREDKEEKLCNKKIYENYEREETAVDSLIKDSIGESIYTNFEYINNKFEPIFSAIFKFVEVFLKVVIGFIFTFVFEFVSLFTAVFGIGLIKENQIFFGVIMWTIAFFTYLLFLNFINSSFLGEVNDAKKRMYKDFEWGKIIKYHKVNYFQIIFYLVIFSAILFIINIYRKELFENVNLFSIILMYYVVPICSTVILLEETSKN